MRSVLASALLVGLVPTLWAGPYNPEETFQPTPHHRARTAILQQKGALLPAKGELDPGSPRYRYLRAIDRLEARVAAGTASTLDRVALSAYLMRVNEPRKARAVLLDADQKQFMVLANLAAACHAQGDLRNAILFQQKALAAWPEVWHDWPSSLNLFYRQCERAYLTLLTSRDAESRAGGTDPLPIDPIFPGFRLEETKPRRYYAEEGLPLALHEKLPHNAGDLVVQLLLWRPADARLYWLYGELTALADPESGFQILEDIAFSTDAGSAFLNLRRHRAALKECKNAMRILKTADGQSSIRAVGMLLSVGILSPGPAGATAQVLGAYAVHAAVPALQAKPPADPPPFPPPAQPTEQLPFNWVHVTASFGFGAMAAALLGLQWQEWRRTRSPA